MKRTHYFLIISLICMIFNTGCQTEQAKTNALGNFFYDRADFEKAKSHYLTALALSNESNNSKISFTINYNLGNTFFKLGELKKSNESYLKAMKIDPNDRDLLFNQALLYARQGLPKKAEDNLVKLLKSNPEDYQARANYQTLKNYRMLFINPLESISQKQALAQYQAGILANSCGVLPLESLFDKIPTLDPNSTPTQKQD